MNQADRRFFLAGIGAMVVTGFACRPAAAAPQAAFQMWHSPGCGCCLEWAKRIESAFGRKLQIIEAQDMAAVKRAHGVPAELQSCHTALIQGVAVEGHVPPADIRRLIVSGRKGTGLAVPGMPLGAPGMESAHGRKQPFKVYAFAPGGTAAIFASYG